MFKYNRRRWRRGGEACDLYYCFDMLKKKKILKSVASTPCPDSKGVATSQSADCICVGGTFEEVG